MKTILPFKGPFEQEEIIVPSEQRGCKEVSTVCKRKYWLFKGPFLNTVVNGRKGKMTNRS
jgi:hypothetical protein